MKTMATTPKELDFVHTGPDDLAGKYLRMFWQPVFCSHELASGRAMPVTLDRLT
jgi:5,5'-dehydrodivanillate O-demethylase oxygenase subunit